MTDIPWSVLRSAALNYPEEQRAELARYLLLSIEPEAAKQALTCGFPLNVFAEGVERVCDLPVNHSSPRDRRRKGDLIGRWHGSGDMQSFRREAPYKRWEATGERVEGRFT